MVGQFENSLMPWRIEGSDSTSMPLNFTPRCVSTWTTAAEKPHCGNTGEPFMKRTTSLPVTSPLMRSLTVASMFRLLFGRRLQRHRVQLVAHAALEGLVNHLMLLDPALALECRRDDVRGVVIAVA